MEAPILGDAVVVEAEPRTPWEALAGTETVALLTAGESERWHLLIAPWPWRDQAIGVLAEPPSTPYIRRATGGPVFPGGGEGAVYAALVGPRRGGRPPRLSSVYQWARQIMEPCRPGPSLTARCDGSTLAGAAGKLAQRPLIEIAGPGEAVRSLLERAVREAAHTYLPREMIRREPLERLRSPEWNWGRVERATHRFEKVTGAGFRLAIEARLEPPLVEDLRLYGDIMVYPPAQALLLVEQLSGIPPSPPAVVEFLNGWATLVEAVGVEYEELRSLLLGAFEALARDAGL